MVLSISTRKIENDVTVIELSGRLALGRESGQIEADADCVLMLYRDDYYDPDSERPGEMDIIVRKNRQGQLGQIATRIDDAPVRGVGPLLERQVVDVVYRR